MGCPMDVAVILAYALAFLVTFLVVFYLPGRMLVARWLPSAEPEEVLPFSLGLGLALIGTLVTLGVGLVGLVLAEAIVTPLVMWGTSLAVTALVGLTGSRPLLRPKALLVRPTRTQAGLWALAFAGLFFFSVHYDDDLLREDGPLLILASSMDVGILGVHTHPSLDGPDAGQGYLPPNPSSVWNYFSLLSGWDGEALGPGILPGGFLTLFGAFGLRLVYAIAGLLLPGLGFALGRSLFRRSWAAWAVALLLTFSPWALENRTFDKNFTANVFGTLALALLLRSRPAALLAGLATGFFLGLHHVELAVLPASLAYLWWRQRDGSAAPRDGWRFLGSLAVGLVPCLVMHVLFVVMHDGTWIENIFDRPTAPHSLFGVELQLPMLLNWPLIPELLRSPYHAYAPLVAYPLDLAARFGVLLVALVPAGAWWLLRARPARALVLAAWFVPLMAFLMLQSNWADPNKMGLPAMASAPFVLLVVGGAVFLVDRARHVAFRATLGVVGLALPLVAVPLLRQHQAPLDERVWKYEDDDDGMSTWSTLAHHLDETPAYVEVDRAQLDPALLPDGRVDHEWRLPVLARALGQFFADLRHPGLSERRNAMPDFLRMSFWGFGIGIAPLRALHTGDPTPKIEDWPDTSPADEGSGEPAVVAWLDLAESPLLAARPLMAGPVPEGVRPLLGESAPLALVSTFQADWAPERGASVLAGRDRRGQVYVVVAPGPPNPNGRPGWLTLDQREAAQFSDRRVPIRVPRNGVVRILELRSYFPAVWYSRYALIEDDGQGGLRILFTRAVLLSPA